MWNEKQKAEKLDWWPAFINLKINKSNSINNYWQPHVTLSQLAQSTIDFELVIQENTRPKKGQHYMCLVSLRDPSMNRRDCLNTRGRITVAKNGISTKVIGAPRLERFLQSQDDGFWKGWVSVSLFMLISPFPLFISVMNSHQELRVKYGLEFVRWRLGKCTIFDFFKNYWDNFAFLREILFL